MLLIEYICPLCNSENEYYFDPYYHNIAECYFCEREFIIRTFRDSLKFFLIPEKAILTKAVK